MSLQNIGRYEIISELGRGAMGLVYKAKDPTIGRIVALKTMRLDVHGLEAEDMLRRFRNEAQAVGVLNHPNVVTIYDAAEQDKIFYIAMEFIEGTTLHQLLTQKRVLSTEEIIRLSRQIGAGLDYAHSHGIIHRDIKPANIMITSNGTVKIMDFGIAKTGGSVTSTGQVLGTPNYMSPEQVKGKTLDGRSDLFSFGVVLYEMLTGEKPFVGQNVTTIIYKIVNEQPTPPRDLDVTIHPGLSAIVSKALAKAPDDRYQSGADLVRDLESYKSYGTKLGPTTPISSGTAAQGEKTTVLPLKLVSGSTARVPAPVPVAIPDPTPTPAPVKAPVPMPQPAAAAKAKTKNIIIAAIAAAVVLGLAMAAYGYHRGQQARQLLAQKLLAQQEAQKRQLQAVADPPVIKQADPVVDPKTPPVAKKSAISPIVKADPKKTKGKGKEEVVPSHQGELKFVSQPEGARVEVDGWSEPSWVTPFTASNLAAGPHRVVFSKAGFSPETRAVEVTAGKSDSVAAQLRPAVSTLHINSTPLNAAIWIDGKDTGKTTPADINVEKGEHRILVRKQGYKDAIATPKPLAEGESYSFAPILTFQQSFWRKLAGGESVPSGKGVLHIQTKPEGASITLNGLLAPKKTEAHWVLDPGSYDVVLQKDGYKPAHRTAIVELGKVVSVDQVLEKQ
jgi:type II secretory pathway pseudopilin PulG